MLRRYKAYFTVVLPVMLKRSLASQFSIGESSYFPERLRMKFEFISCELIFLDYCGCKSEFQV